MSLYSYITHCFIHLLTLIYFFFPQSNSAFTTDDNDKDEDSTELGYIIDKTGSVSEPEGNEEDEEDEEDQDNFTEHEQDSRGSHHKNKNKKENNNNNNNKKDKQQGKGHKSQQKQTLLWNDTDDSNLSVSIVEKARLKKLRKSEDETSISGSEFSSRLRGHFEQVNKVPEWAKIDEATKKKNANKLAQKRSKSSTSSNGDDDDDDDEYESNDDDDDNDDENDDENDSIFQSTSSLLISRTGASASKATLPSKMIDTLRVKDGNVSEYSPATIQSIGFHPTAPVMLTAGLDKTIRLFQVK